MGKNKLNFLNPIMSILSEQSIASEWHVCKFSFKLDYGWILVFTYYVYVGGIQ